MRSTHYGWIALAVAPLLLAQPIGRFSPTGAMTVPRSGHTATLLLDGRVLIAGGNDTNCTAPSASAEFYDPVKGTFTPTVGTAPHAFGTATLLADGTVLLAGGQGCGAKEVVSAVLAVLYDPVTGSFRAVSDMAEPHSIATLLADGRVLMTGYPSVHAEIYDPVTGTFTLGDPYGDPLSCESPDVLLADGRVLIGEVQPPVLFDPGTGRFTRTGAMIYCGHDGASLLMNGQVLFAGGNADFFRSNRAELYDPRTGAFRATGNLIEHIDWPSSTLLPDGTAMFAGGEIDNCTAAFCEFGGSTPVAEVYNAISGTFAASGSMSTKRELHTSTVLNDGTVLIAGGVSYGGIGIFYGTLASAEIYHPAVRVPRAALLSLSGDGKGPGAIQHASTYQVVSADKPAAAGEILVVYCTGFVDGGVIPTRVSIGGRAAEVLWFGNTPGYAGLNQINVRVPNGLAPGDAVPVRMNYLGRPSNEVTIAVR